VNFCAFVFILRGVPLGFYWIFVDLRNLAEGTPLGFHRIRVHLECNLGLPSHFNDLWHLQMILVPYWDHEDFIGLRWICVHFVKGTP
jgi:hypothetical protein